MAFTDFWNSLDSRGRLGIGAGCAALVIALLGGGAWLLRTDYQVLFADLKPQDTAVMVAELDRLKIPYRIGHDGNTILVDATAVHATRLKLMGKDMPLHGAAGFELFNNADFGMTEFAQKINYQRALQGEITRTILSLAEVRDARVHLALPEEGLFKRASSKPKAAITLGLKTGERLRAEQVAGIQRLVAAAVPGISVADVTIVDQQGIALTRTAGSEADADSGTARLDLKRDTERMLARKATDVLERAFGSGQVLASVDVTLSMDHVRVTTEDVLPAPGRLGAAATGVVVRERENARDVAPPLGSGDASVRQGSSQREVEYQVGRRVEQVASQPGAIRRLNVVAVVRQPLDDKQVEQVRELVAAAVGAVSDRGDSVVVQSIRAFAGAPEHDAVPDSPPLLQGSRSPSVDGVPQFPTAYVLTGACLFLATATALLAWLRSRKRADEMNAEERQAVLDKLQQWMNPPAAEAADSRKGVSG